MNKILPAMFSLMIIAGCGGESRDQAEPVVEEPGTLVLTANGEDFVREGFTSKDGWEIVFDHVYVTLAQIQPARTDPPFEPESDMEFSGERDLIAATRPVTVDLKADSTVEVARLTADPGHYNALSWMMVPAEEGPSTGYSMLLEGTAAKEGETLPFRIGIEASWLYEAGDYVGEERRGMLRSGSEADLEMTFHMDHLFGDADLPAEDALNQGAPGFSLFQWLADTSQVTDLAVMEEMLSPEEYEHVFGLLGNLGHVGEGHARSLVVLSEPAPEPERIPADPPESGEPTEP